MLPEWEGGSLKNTCIVGSEVTNPRVYPILWIDINSCLAFYNIIHWSFEKWRFIELHRSTNMTYFITLNQKSHLLIPLPTLADRPLSMRNTWSSVSKILSSVTNMVRDQLTSFSYQTMSNKCLNKQHHIKKRLQPELLSVLKCLLHQTEIALQIFYTSPFCHANI